MDHSLPGSSVHGILQTRILEWVAMTTGKTIALTRQTFVGKVMSLLFNMLSRMVITFLPRSKHLLISWLQSPSAVILGSPKIKSDTVSRVSPSIVHEVMGPDAMIFVFWMLSFKPTFSLPREKYFSTLDGSITSHFVMLISIAVPYYLLEELVAGLPGWYWSPQDTPVSYIKLHSSFI